MENILTVVIPTYNMEKYLDKCLSSLIIEDEKMDMLEVLVINDGSKDRSSEIAHGYEARYPQTFRVIDKENGNYGSCVNRGLAEATGKYIKILDADDWYLSDNFSEFVTFLSVQNVDLIISDVVKVLEDGHQIGKVSYSFLPESFTLTDFPDNISTLMAMHSVTYRTDNLRKIGYHQTEGISYTDLEWIFWPMTTVEKASYFNKVIYSYLLGRSGQTMDPAVYQKNIWMDVVGIKSMLSVYCAVKQCCDETHLKYLQGQLELRVSVLYRFYLLASHKLFNQEDLILFDLYLRDQAPDIYDLTDRSVIANRGVDFHYIHDWRKHKSRCTVSYMLYDMYTMVKRFRMK